MAIRAQIEEAKGIEETPHIWLYHIDAYNIALQLPTNSLH